MTNVECPECGEEFDPYALMGPARALRLEWAQLFDHRLRAVLSGELMLIMPRDSPASVLPIRGKLHECEPGWPDYLRARHDDEGVLSVVVSADGVMRASGGGSVVQAMAAAPAAAGESSAPRVVNAQSWATSNTGAPARLSENDARAMGEGESV